MKDYNKLCTSDTNNCTVIAVSKALNVSMSEAYAALDKAGRIHGDGAHMSQVKCAVTLLGGRVINQTHKIYHLRSRLGKAITVKSVGEWLSTGRYIMSTTTHAFALLHGTVDDWCYDSKAHVGTVFKITKGVR